MIPVDVQACTPTDPGCGTEDSVLQTVTDLSSCSYHWQSTPTGSCTGGSASWQYSAWTPTCGVGPVTQTRGGNCVPVANSGTQSEQVQCIRTDGAVVADSFCASPKPATLVACTPAAAPSSCGTEGVLTQKVTLTTKCPITACVAWVGPEFWNGTLSYNPGQYSTDFCNYDVSAFGGPNNATCHPNVGSCTGTPTVPGIVCYTNEPYSVISSGAVGNSAGYMISQQVSCVLTVTTSH